MPVRLLAVVGLVASLLLAGCTGSPGPEGANAAPAASAMDGGHLEGSVVSEGFVGIADAIVKIVGSSHETRTGWDGGFSFPALMPGKYGVRVEAIGWHPAVVSADVVEGATTKLTIFVEPLLLQEPYSTVKGVRGTLSCIAVRVITTSTEDMTCTSFARDLAFADDWAATVTEVQWGKSGTSTTPHSRVSLLSKNASSTPAPAYGRVVGEDPAKLILRPDTLHTQYQADVQTPPKGERGPLFVEVSKSPVALAAGVDVHTGLTVQESFEVWHTTFYVEAPHDVDDYSALPN